METLTRLRLGDEILIPSATMHITAERTERGLLLQDIHTGHKILVPLDDEECIDETQGITEGIIPVELCDKQSFRIMDVPAREYKGKYYRMVMCCITGYWDETTGRCIRPYFVPHAIIHPPERSIQVIRRFLSGELTRMREKFFSLIRMELG